MIRYIYIDNSYQDAYLRNSSEMQRTTMNAVAKFMSAPDTANEQGIGKKLIIKGVTKDDYKKYTDNLRNDISEKYDDTYIKWMEYITRACSQGDTSIVEFDDEQGSESIEFFDKLVNDSGVDKSKLNDTYWLSHCLCDKSKIDCQSLEHKYGVSFISVEDDITNHEPDATFLVKDGEYNWITMIDQKSSNTIIVLDQYIFHSDSMIDVNIMAILKQLVSTDSKMQITIYTHKNLCYNKTDSTCLNDLETRIKNELQVINHNVTINVLNTADLFHDRLILTNNYYITIGGGFDVLKTGTTSTGNHTSCKNTTLHVYANPVMSSKDWLRNEYYGYINAIKMRYNQFLQQQANSGAPLLYPNRLI